jgi:glycosyltransferase involved in cell wall biosynthesis
MTDAAGAPGGHEIDITVAVSCYNEEDLIAATLDSVVDALTDIGRLYEIVVVDDASRDNSVQRIRDYIAARPNLPIKLKVNTINRGLGFNYAEAAFAGKGKYYRLTCGDNGEPKEVLINLFRHIGSADMVIPYNYKQVAGKNHLRHFLSETYTVLVNLISGYNIRYYNGLAIHLRYNVIRWPSSSYGFGFQADIITRLLDEGASYLQVPSYSIDRKGSTSTALSVRNVLSVTHTFVEIGIRRLRSLLYGRKVPAPVEVFLKDSSPASTEQAGPKGSP